MGMDQNETDMNPLDEGKNTIQLQGETNISATSNHNLRSLWNPPVTDLGTFPLRLNTVMCIHPRTGESIRFLKNIYHIIMHSSLCLSGCLCLHRYKFLQ